MLKGGGRMKGEYMFTIDSCHGDVNMIDTGVSEVHLNTNNTILVS